MVLSGLLAMKQHIFKTAGDTGVRLLFKAHPSKICRHRPKNRVVQQHHSSQLRECARKHPGEIDQRLIAWMTKRGFFLWRP
jgi:hypothetical protein